MSQIRAQIENPATRPTVGVLFAVPYDDPPCGPKTSWTTQVRQLLTVWKQAGMKAFLVPAVPPASSKITDPIVQNDATADPKEEKAAFYRDMRQYPGLAAADPGDVGILDAGRYLRDSSGQYQWEMPCVEGGEAGCSAAQTVAVRNPVDGGLHFCADPSYAFTGALCGAKFAAGERRAASSLAFGLIVSLQTLTRASGIAGLTSSSPPGDPTGPPARASPVAVEVEPPTTGWIAVVAGRR
jgi:hypothetical protein